MLDFEKVDEVPNFDDGKIADVIWQLYGIKGKISPLNAFEDQNALIKTQGESFVFKISNKKTSIDDLTTQTLLLEHLRDFATEISCPVLVPSKRGDMISFVDGFAVRLVAFIKGNTLGESARNSELNYNIGRCLGIFSRSTQHFKGHVAAKPKYYWNLDNALACKTFIYDVEGESMKMLISQFYQHYEENVMPKLGSLRKGIIHGDANEHNLLVDEHLPFKIAGLIDFGDMQWATLINDLAIGLAYSLLGVDDIKSTAEEIINGYHKEFPIQDGEFEVLSDLIVMRLITSIILTSNRAKKYPNNTYILCSQEPARALLKRLEVWEFKIPFTKPTLESP